MGAVLHPSLTPPHICNAPHTQTNNTGATAINVTMTVTDTHKCVRPPPTRDDRHHGTSDHHPIRDPPIKTPTHRPERDVPDAPDVAVDALRGLPQRAGVRYTVRERGAQQRPPLVARLVEAGVREDRLEEQRPRHGGRPGSRCARLECQVHVALKVIQWQARVGIHAGKVAVQEHERFVDAREAGGGG
eukprot:359787-Chlamydomonas_euryale.AAC.8